MYWNFTFNEVNILTSIRQYQCVILRVLSYRMIAFMTGEYFGISLTLIGQFNMQYMDI